MPRGGYHHISMTHSDRTPRSSPCHLSDDTALRRTGHRPDRPNPPAATQGWETHRVQSQRQVQPETIDRPPQAKEKARKGRKPTVCDSPQPKKPGPLQTHAGIRAAEGQQIPIHRSPTFCCNRTSLLTFPSQKTPPRPPEQRGGTRVGHSTTCPCVTYPLEPKWPLRRCPDSHAFPRWSYWFAQATRRV
jgi:hypothetical protein